MSLPIWVIPGCQSAKPKSGELWLIDSQDATLYRYLNNGEEEYIPIKDNGVVSDFVCFDIRFIDDVCATDESSMLHRLEEKIILNVLE